MMYRYWLDRHMSSSGILRLAEAVKQEIPFAVLAEELYGMKEDSLRLLLKEAGRLKEKDIEKLVQSRRYWDVPGEFAGLMEKQIAFTSLEDGSYPMRLRDIYQPPYALYYRGKLPPEEQLQIAVVGARGRSAYGQELARGLAKALAMRNVGIISGLAAGIDTDSHKGAIEGGGNTYAVLGCGVDVIYPRQNSFLYNDVINAGGVISELPPRTPAIAHNFPLRNRIIAGLCDKLIVIEARLKSGSLITADFAMEQGRDVYALPGRVTDELSQGTNRLLRQGAGVITSVEDFLEELKLDIHGSYVQQDFCKNLLEKEEAMVYSLVDFHPIGLGALLAQSKMELSQLLGILENLKSLGLIRECTLNYFVRTLQS